jgi:CheY-like chemotaxis protein
MQFDTFETLIKDALNNLFDFAILETHPLLSNGITIPTGYSGSKGVYVKKVLLAAVETLKPADKSYDINTTEWRVYIVLLNRYLEGMNSIDVAKLLAMSERQYRRYQKKAIQSVALLIWNRFFLSKSDAAVEKTQESSQSEFNIFREEIILADIIIGLQSLLATRLSEERVTFKIQEEGITATIESDRVILRQILIEIVNTLLNFKTRQLTFEIHQIEEKIALSIRSTIPFDEGPIFEVRENDQENNIWFWLNKLGLTLERINDPITNQTVIRIFFNKNEQKKILIIDDQEPAIRLFTRYLSRSNVKIIGFSKPEIVLYKVKEVQPDLIILDIMMPKMDGWEVLQSLKLDEQTKTIPVIICSAWGEHELAKSLGAVDFLRKPVTQRDLLVTIHNAGIYIE